MVRSRRLTGAYSADVRGVPDTFRRLAYRVSTLSNFGSMSSLTLAGVGTVVETNPRIGRPQGACSGMGVATNTMRHPCS